MPKTPKTGKKQQYIPLTEPKHTTEVAAIQKPPREELEIIEQVGRKPTKRRTAKRTTKKSTSSKKTVSKPLKPKIKKLTGKAILIVTEKPQAASKISMALSEGKARKIASSGVSYYEFQRDNENIIVACAVGHLFSLSQDEKGSDYPVFNISWKPNFEVRKKDFTKKYYQAIARLVKKAKEIIVATDYDTEGEVIGYNVVRFIANQPDAKRMKFSSLTAKEIEKAYKDASANIDWGQAIAGETRHYLDWFYGINLSRALMNSIKSAGRFRIMSIGRVQGPALNLIVQKEKEIQAFVPTPFWRIFLDIIDQKDKTNKLRVKYIKDIIDKKELKKFENLKDKECDVSTKKTEQIIPPPSPFDLTSLQTEAYSFFSITPSKTLQIAQQLYLNGLISYPRTSSQKIPDSINPKNILKRLSKMYDKEVKLTKRKKPVEGKKSDPAHPSIYPTGEFGAMNEDEKKIYDLIVRRFIACFCEDAIVENKTITAEINELKFKAKGLEIRRKAWMEVYKAKLKEKELNDMDGKALIEKVTIEEDKTKPPKRYSPASIVTELEKRGLGTKATRANIIETLYDRNYIMDNKSIKATVLGMHIINSLEEHSPIIIDEKLTREIEKDMESMQINPKKQELEKKEQEVLEDSKKTLEKISKDFKKNQEKIGKDLIKATEESWKQEEKANEIMQCPVCKKGMLTIKYSPKNRRHFVACNAYPKCKTTYSLPPNALIKTTDKICEHCNFKMLMSIKKGKRPWIFCFNPECPSRQQKEEEKKVN